MLDAPAVTARTDQATLAVPFLHYVVPIGAGFGGAASLVVIEFDAVTPGELD